MRNMTPKFRRIDLYEKDRIVKEMRDNEEIIVEENINGARVLFMLKDNECELYRNHAAIGKENIIENFPQLKVNKTNKMLVLEGFLSGLSIESMTYLMVGNLEALAKNIGHEVYLNVFDCLRINDIDIMPEPYFKRRVILDYIVKALNNDFINLIKASRQKKEFYDFVRSKNGHGIVYKNILNKYTAKETWLTRPCINTLYASITSVSDNKKSIGYGLLTKDNKIIEYGKVSNRKKELVKEFEDLKEKAIGKIIEVEYQYITIKYKLRCARINKICYEKKEDSLWQIQKLKEVADEKS